MKIKTIIFSGLFTTSVFVLMVFSACKKQENNTGCFSSALQQKSIGLFCIDDCPGVNGCDGKIYCNACYAAKAGITVIP